MADLTQDPASTATTDGASEGYRPLSLMALVGFILALLFVASVLVGGLAAFGGQHPRWLVVWLVVALVGGWLLAQSLKRPVLGTIGLALAGLTTLVGLFGLVTCSATSPWLLPWPVWILVGAALLMCWLASSRIAASEGTLGGAALARWGVGLVLFFTLNYGAYYLSSIYAVRAQGRECTDEFLELVKASDKEPFKLYEAFARTMTHGARHRVTDLRRAVEVESNAGQGITGGAYSTFVLNTTVRLVQTFGEDAKYEKIGTAEEHDKGGYRVRVTYRVTGKLGVADFDLFAFGEESIDGAVVRRQWHIEVIPVPMEAMANNFRSTDEGRGMIVAISSSKNLAQQWLDEISAHRIEGAYLATVAPDERRAQIEAQIYLESGLFSLPGWVLGDALKASTRDLEAFERGVQTFRSGSILDVTELYPPAGSAKEQDRQEIIARVQKFLSGETSTEARALLARADLPRYHRTGDTIAIGFPIQIMTREAGKTRVIEGDLEIVGPWSTEPIPPSRYRIRGFRLYRGPESGAASREMKG
jgi:hypothetical protein